jgi:putative heme iron utilization protein
MHWCFRQSLFTWNRDQLRENTGLDRYGFEMSAMTSNGPRPLRLAFAKPVSTPEDERATLISMGKDARSKLAAEAL